MRIQTELNLQNFYQKEMDIASIIEEHDKIILKMFTRSKNCKCPKC